MLCIEELVWKLFGLLTTNTFKAKIYKLGTVCMSNFLNPLLQELDLVPASFSLFFLFKYTLCAVGDEPKTIVPYFISG
jgi:hypothetical protein